MKIRRLAASVSASFEQFIGKMENHEALANSVIADVQQAAVRVRGERRRVDQRIERLNRIKVQLEEEKSRWKHRAKSCLPENEGRALDCLKQLKLLEGRAEQVCEHLKQARRLREKLNAQLTDIDQKLQELQTRKAMLASREASAKAAEHCADVLSSDGIESSFERWEQDVALVEYKSGESGGGVYCDEDFLDRDLARTFEEEEGLTELTEAMEALKQELKGEGK